MREKTERIIHEWTDSCDAEVSIAVLGGAWKPSILTLLGEHGVLRFGELGRLLKDPTARVLTRQLRELEDDGLIIRTVYRQVPPKVEYRLSDLGASAAPLLAELTTWGTLYAGTQREASAAKTAENEAVA
ncbi:helix-turn-helix domain-containing protein [Microbacterium algeriense]|jgi:DNA-binding HxlR family transcriptional regulator|uniref:winged helix-turn-helix transcriptional regulator n=1 Tax=Microbacterium algeriense TaxID=2615184 RepID=UPI0022E28452|nr:helix-turn-helix domain-containing protein [Microbacterium algeriense]MDX2399107.1 helix-turn-helix transcriptional regulator [Microbacterium algeriense]